MVGIDGFDHNCNRWRTIFNPRAWPDVLNARATRWT
jgi:hypothetical protein